VLPESVNKVRKFLFSLFFFFPAFSSPGQYVEYPFLSITVFPGLGTSGLDPANMFSDISLNLFTGYQRGTYILELSGINSINIDRTYGIQISGLANMTGINLYQGVKPKDIKKEIARGHYAELKGFQVSGLLNFVRGDGSGAQISGGANITQDMLTGAQVSGIFNFSSILVTGAQLSLLSNISSGTTLGVQVASILNYTKNQLSGFQIGATNLAETIEGKNSISDDHSTAFQFGLINRARTMNGYQIGLINMGGNCRGVQVGLVNFYSTRYKNGKLNGTPVAPLNIGSNTSLRCYYDETFNLNIALGTGNSKNGNIYERRKTLYIMNQLMYRKSDWICRSELLPQQ
jgi:hypothetical protein